ncbi:MAG TPA: class I SAM-dependent methyltransferase [Gemmatimonadales bacterium]|nr:class I SAM-dependent methyltransferase [Gemmatimonadales bacterium]
MTSPQAPFDNRQYWESRLRGHFSLAGVGYLRLGRRYNEWMYRVRGEVFDRVVAGLEPRQQSTFNGQQAAPGRIESLSSWAGRDVLDVGSGTGFYVDRWLRLGARVTGLDLTEIAVVELLRTFPAARFLRADIGASLNGIPLAPGSFDAVSAFDVLFHIVDDAQYARAFENIAALLRPGGWFLWSDNFLRHKAERVAHQASRPLAESARLVEMAGFEIVARRPMFVLMNYPADTTSRLLRWGWTAMVAPAVLGEPLGWALGAMLYPVERALVRRRRESPSTELMVCRKTQAR